MPFRDRGGQDFWPGVVGLVHVDPSNLETGCLLTDQITGRGVNSEANRRKEIVRESLHLVYIHSLGRTFYNSIGDFLGKFYYVIFSFSENSIPL